MTVFRKWIITLLAIFIVGQAGIALAFDPFEEELSMEHVLLIEAQSEAELFSKNADERAYPASTTKILTCMIALEQGDLDAEVTVGDEVERFSKESSLMHIRAGEKVRLRDLIYGMMLVSGNDAAATIAVHMGGSIQGFADMMNEKAALIGMQNSNFVNPHGTHKEEHYSTARDMAKLAAYAMKSADFRKIVSTGVYEVKPTNKNKDGYKLENTNMLIHTTEKNKEKGHNYEYRYAIGIKTGMTPVAKNCLVSAAEKDGITLICVQLLDDDTYNRFKTAKDLFEWGFSNYVSNSAVDLALETDIEVLVSNASFEDDGKLKLNVDITGKEISCTKADWERLRNNASQIKADFVPTSELVAPIKEGDLVGEVLFKFEGSTLFKANAYANRSIMQMGAAISPSLPPVAVMNTGGSAGPWLFIILVIVALPIIAGTLFLIVRRRKRNMRRRRRGRGVYAYRR